MHKSVSGLLSSPLSSCMIRFLSLCLFVLSAAGAMYAQWVTATVGTGTEPYAVERLGYVDHAVFLIVAGKAG